MKLVGMEKIDVKQLIIFLLVILSITFCHCNNNSKEKEVGKVTLTYWSASNQYEIDLAKTLVQQWNKAHPDVNKARTLKPYISTWPLHAFK